MFDLSHPRAPQLIILLSGAILIAFGMILIVIQFGQEVQEVAAHQPQQPRFGKVSKHGAELVTTYVGLMVVAIGAALEALGYLATRPWKAAN